MKLTTKQLAHAFVEIAEGKKGKDLEQAAKSFVELLAERGKLVLYRDIVAAVDIIWKEKYGAANINIQSADPLSKVAKEALEKQANGATITEEVQKDLIGGAKLRIDDRIIDGTIKGSLDLLKQRLSQAL